MWAWYFVILVLLLMFVVQFISSRRKEPMPGLKKILPLFNQEAGEEVTPEHYKNKNQVFIERITGKPLPFFETTLDLHQIEPHRLNAQWSVGENFKKELTEKYGGEFWHNARPILRIHHTNAVPTPYHRDIKINLEDGSKEIVVNSPGETINGEIGLITETGSFIALIHSNDVTIPKQS
ncbi:MAG: DUF4912 domain-containing protein [Bacillota bacterium]